MPATRLIGSDPNQVSTNGMLGNLAFQNAESAAFGMVSIEQLLAASGTAAAPTYTFSGDRTSGVYLQGTGQLALATSGTERFRIDNNGQIEAAGLGSGGAPAYSWISDPDSGLYSPGANQVALATGGTGRLFVDANGNVGIKASSPFQYGVPVADLAHIQLTSQQYSIITFGATAGATGQKYWRFISRGNEKKFQFQSVDDSGTNEATAIEVVKGTAQEINNIQLHTNGSERLRIDSSGRVGIGTSSPQGLFHLQQPLSDSTPILALGEGSNNVRYSIIQESGYTGFSHGNQNINLKFKTYAGGGSGGTISFWTGVNSASERVTIDSSGRLGIGTTSPATTVHAVGTIRISRSDNAAQYLNLYSSGGEGFIDAVNSNSGVNQPIVFRSGNNSTTVECARIDSSGRVGIGTSSPERALDVAGYIQVPSGAFGGGGYLFRYRTAEAASRSWLLTTDDKANGDFIISTSSTQTGNPTTPRFYISPTGLVGIGTTSPIANGGILQLSSGITFPAVQVASADPNTLDDYEEGTWTPTLFNSGGGSIATSSVAGRYVKIGTQVTCWATIIASSGVSGTSDPYLYSRGLPFAVGTTSPTPDPVGFGIAGQMISSGLDRKPMFVRAFTSFGTTSAFIYRGETGFTGGATFEITFSYRTID